jgi:hypothetical protein
MRRFPWHGTLGLVLVLLFWWLNWGLSGLRTHWAFFPLWLGYCLVVDALAVFRKGNSLMTRHPRRYIGLFVISVPTWWLFELLNRRTQNWIYDGRQYFSDVEYALLASLSFATVMPAVFGTAEWMGTWSWMERFRRGWRLAPTRRTSSTLFLCGWVMLALLLAWPRFFFPLLWGAVFAILEPINVWLGNPSLLRHTARGDWRPVVALGAGCLLCGFFWEMWNYYSYPKWQYHIPFVDVLPVFEMPILGYGGYLPFALELFAIYSLLGTMFTGTDNEYLELVNH